MSDAALKILQDQVSSLTASLQSLTSERDEYRDALESIAAERDELKASAAEPDVQAQRIAELEAAIRDRNHFDKFAELAKVQKVKDKAIKDLWKVSGYAADGDPDEKKLAALVADLKIRADYAFDIETVAEAPTPPEKSRSGLELREKPAPPAHGRGERNDGSDATIVTREQRADPKFMLNPANRELIVAAAKEGRFR